MDEEKPKMDFQPTKEQKDFFKGTEYGKPENIENLKETIVARIITGDDSAGNITPEQRSTARKIQERFSSKMGTDGYGQPTTNIPGLPAINGFPAGAVGFTPTVVDPQLAIQQEKMAKEKKDAALQAQQNVDKSKDFMKSLDALEKHPGFSNLFGTNVGVPTWIPGSAGADAKAIYEQIQGKGFLEAIQSMKGMGALSNAEGEKVSAAFLGLKPGMSEAAAKKQISEAKAIIQRGIENAAKIQTGVLSTETAPVDPYAAATSRLRGLVTPK